MTALRFRLSLKALQWIEDGVPHDTDDLVVSNWELCQFLLVRHGAITNYGRTLDEIMTHVDTNTLDSGISLMLIRLIEYDLVVPEIVIDYHGGNNG